ncbi:MAG: hypothetical protein RMJ44_11430 [Cytophagales bacterium]|nr:hypothetical protein [Bernardetiaceae bacterium]MDW8211687.1 hypothetical protein [Cytophagales bacterium]
MNSILFNEDFLHLEYLSQENVLLETWYGFVDYARFVTATPIILQAIEQTGAQLVLCDLSRLKRLRENVFAYLTHEKARQLAKKGVVAYALCVDPQRAEGVAANPINVQIALGGSRLHLVSFSSAREAGIWLKQQMLQPQLNR